MGPSRQPLTLAKPVAAASPSAPTLTIFKLWRYIGSVGRSAAPVTEVGGGIPPGRYRAAGASQGPIARGSVARVGTATALTALCGYAVIYLAARDLAPSGFSVFGVFWGAFGLVTGAANGLLQETTREVRSTRYLERACPAPATRAPIRCGSPRWSA